MVEESGQTDLIRDSGGLIWEEIRYNTVLPVVMVGH